MHTGFHSSRRYRHEPCSRARYLSCCYLLFCKLPSRARESHLWARSSTVPVGLYNVLMYPFRPQVPATLAMCRISQLGTLIRHYRMEHRVHHRKICATATVPAFSRQGKTRPKGLNRHPGYRLFVPGPRLLNEWAWLTVFWWFFYSEACLVGGFDAYAKPFGVLLMFPER